MSASWGQKCATFLVKLFFLLSGWHSQRLDRHFEMRLTVCKSQCTRNGLPKWIRVCATAHDGCDDCARLVKLVLMEAHLMLFVNCLLVLRTLSPSWQTWLQRFRIGRRLLQIAGACHVWDASNHWCMWHQRLEIWGEGCVLSLWIGSAWL